MLTFESKTRDILHEHHLTLLFSNPFVHDAERNFLFAFRAKAMQTRFRQKYICSRMKLECLHQDMKPYLLLRDTNSVCQNSAVNP